MFLHILIDVEYPFLLFPIKKTTILFSIVFIIYFILESRLYLGHTFIFYIVYWGLYCCVNLTLILILIFNFWWRNPRTSKNGMPSAKQLFSDIKHSRGTRPNVCTLTFVESMNHQDWMKAQLLCKIFWAILCNLKSNYGWILSNCFMLIGNIKKMQVWWIMKDIAQIVRLLVTTVLLIVPPILLIGNKLHCIIILIYLCNNTTAIHIWLLLRFESTWYLF